MRNIDFWFYSLSAISQTLAAIIALSATFVIFKLDEIQRHKQSFIEKMFRFLMLLNYHDHIHDILKNSKKDKDILELLKPIDKLNSKKEFLGFEDYLKTKEDIQKLFKKFKEEMNFIISGVRGQYEADKESIYGFLIQQKEIFEKLVHAKEDIHRRLTYTIILNAFTIIASLLLIPLQNIPLLQNIPIYILLLIVYVVIFFAGLSIIITAFSMYKIAKYDL